MSEGQGEESESLSEPAKRELKDSWKDQKTTQHRKKNYNEQKRDATVFIATGRAKNLKTVNAFPGDTTRKMEAHLSGEVSDRRSEKTRRRRRGGPPGRVGGAGVRTQMLRRVTHIYRTEP